jgi:hypothetical protein
VREQTEEAFDPGGGWRCFIGLAGSQTFCHRGTKGVDGSLRSDDGWTFLPHRNTLGTRRVPARIERLGERVTDVRWGAVLGREMRDAATPRPSGELEQSLELDLAQKPDAFVCGGISDRVQTAQQLDHAWVTVRGDLGRASR